MVTGLAASVICSLVGSISHRKLILLAILKSETKIRSELWLGQITGKTIHLSHLMNLQFIEHKFCYCVAMCVIC